ncbi:hypothetical protein EVAR_90845_1 [Eumeta japonica]|uniref:Uncharacterized protein n=1 Tax=Eumeta variegata TaxID=151549 RepID=A0A4C1ZUX5_EUMVA|nr:hypothetical protein EVAR_90845_1 [Eumeta japonica]
MGVSSQSYSGTANKIFLLIDEPIVKTSNSFESWDKESEWTLSSLRPQYERANTVESPVCQPLFPYDTRKPLLILQHFQNPPKWGAPGVKVPLYSSLRNIITQ